MLIIKFGSGRSRAFVIQSDHVLKLICINPKSMTVSVSVSDNSSHLEDGQLTAPVMGGVCCQTVRRQTGTKTPGHALGASVCANEAAEQRTTTYSLGICTCFSYGYLAVYVVSTPLVACQDRWAGIEIWVLSLAQYIGYWFEG